MARRRNADQRVLHDLSRMITGGRGPSRRSIQRATEAGDLHGVLRQFGNAMRGGDPVAQVQRYARSMGLTDTSLVGWLQRAWNMLGGPGLKTRPGRRGNDPLSIAINQIAAVLDTPPLVRPSGRGAGSPPRRPRTQTAPGAPQPPGGGGVSAPAPAPGGPTGTWPFSGRFPGSTLEYGAEPPLPGQQSPFGEEVLTPQSSNVFSFSYMRLPGQKVGTLYVTYKAAALNTKSISSGHVRRGKSVSRRQLIGQRGKTLSGKTNDRGAQYAYYNVPPGVFTRMKAATSKGKFVWDNLRVRGTIYGHKYQYGLVQGSISLGSGVSGVYIPRKATPQGYRSRSVRDIGGKGFQTSTLPGQKGFSTRSRSR